ncbi:hypothetical protein HH212_17010 [Massilia forsythiae]|uniref:AbiEi antitoxin C-terminal domain-containing protein n=1 Tax=Massilia forsythiae TaxID=2728020 RepID=A0A7Z2VY04_9BURK|nr:hypothetical protein [Massilia forsythiae]QJE01516.1 hypothetical protein HH212_17010 [Massilia forsythiae]
MEIGQKQAFTSFLEKLIDAGILDKFEFPFPYRSEKRYALPQVPMLEVLQSLKPNSYYTHATAAVVHGLIGTETERRTIYINHEQRPHIRGELADQPRIDAAFKTKARVSSNAINLGGTEICMLNGMHTGQLGVITAATRLHQSRSATIRVTGLERTLIDIVVRPSYAGGVETVLSAFRKARDKVDNDLLMHTLAQLGHVYPYHQAIGWYMDKAGYPLAALELIATLPKLCRFYVAHQMSQPSYDDKWALYVPASLA